MKKRILSIGLFLLLLVTVTLPSLAGEQRVFDQAGLFTPDQIVRLEEEIESFRKQTGQDFVLLTTQESYSSIESYADQFYDAGDFGTGAKESGVLLVINLNQGEFHFSTSGEMIDYLYDSRMNSLVSAVGASLKQGRSTGDYSQAVSKAISLIQSDVKQGIPEGHYQYDVNTGRQTTSGYKKIEWKELLISLGIALVVAGIVYGKTNSDYSLKGSTYSYDRDANSTKVLTASQDAFLRTETRVVEHPQVQPGGGGRPGGMGGGHSGGFHSGTHISSGGHTHGGGGGHF